MNYRNEQQWTPENQVYNMDGVESISIDMSYDVDNAEEGESENHKSEDPCSSSSLPHDGVTEVHNAENFDAKSVLDEEHTPVKAIIQVDQEEHKEPKDLHLDKDSLFCKESDIPSVIKSGQISGSTSQHESPEKALEHARSNHQTKETTLVNSEESGLQVGAETNLVQVLWRQLESLALREREVEESLTKERIENIVAKVEEEVEFEGIVEDMCLRFRAEGEFMDMERRERDWERERREVRLEEEVKILRNRVQYLEEEIRVANAQKEFVLQKNAIVVHDNFSNVQKLSNQSCCHEDSEHQTTDQAEGTSETFVKTGNEDIPDAGGENMIPALKEMLFLAEQDRKALENSFQYQQQKWTDTEQGLRTHISALETELDTMQCTLKEKESFLSLERERRRQYGLEVDKVLAFWREENSVHNLVRQRLKKVECMLAECVEKVTHLMLSEEPEPKTFLSELLQDLESLDTDSPSPSTPSKSEELLKFELVESWKHQRDRLAVERDKLEEQLVMIKAVAKENEERIKALWQERERNLVKRVRELESGLTSEDILSQLGMSGSRNREMCEIEAIAYKKAWQEEQEKVKSMIAEREQWAEENNQEWLTLLDEKEEELCALKSVQQKLWNSLTTSKKHLMNVTRQLVRHRKYEDAAKVQNAVPFSDEERDSCSDGSGSEINCCNELVPYNENVVTNHFCHEEYVTALQLSADIEEEIRRLAKEVHHERDRWEKERMNVRVGTEQLKEERKELERKVTDALNLMEDMRGQIKSKEGQIERERKQMESLLASRTEEVEKLNEQLAFKDQEIGKLKVDIRLVQAELEKEQKERKDYIEVHVSSRQKLIEEMKETETKWEKEMETTGKQIQDLQKEINEKNEEIMKLKKELTENNDQLAKQTENISGVHSEQAPNENLALIDFVRNNVDQLNTSGPSDKRGIAWQDVIGKIAGFDKQITEAMLAIESLKEELNAKEKELQRARLERDANRRTWIHDQSQTKEIVERNMIVDLDQGPCCTDREHAFLEDSDDLIKFLEAERADTADAMSILEGAARELQWALSQYKSTDGGSGHLELDQATQVSSTKGELVKVHASHLEELDRFILELKFKAEEAEKRARAAEVSLAVNSMKDTITSGDVSALMKAQKAWESKGRIGYNTTDADETFAGLNSQGLGHFMRNQLSFNESESEKDGVNHRTWPRESNNHDKFWVNSGSRMDIISSSNSNGWMTIRGATDDSFLMHDSLTQGSLTLAVSNPTRGQRKWLVDGAWLENVRKEQAALRHQLEFERQRIFELKQVEVENRLMEATVVQALEKKRESDTKVLELEQKVSFLEAMIAQKGGKENPSSSKEGARFL